MGRGGVSNYKIGKDIRNLFYYFFLFLFSSFKNWSSCLNLRRRSLSLLLRKGPSDFHLLYFVGLKPTSTESMPPRLGSHGMTLPLSISEKQTIIALRISV